MKKILFYLLIIFIIFYFLGHFGPSYLEGTTCLPFLGCNSGPFGYDAFLHVISGVLYVIAIIGFQEKYPQLTFLTKKFWLNAFIIISMTTLFSVGWETIEFIHDRIRLVENPAFATNALDQPTNDDTMGDLLVSFVASGATIVLLKKQIQK